MPKPDTNAQRLRVKLGHQVRLELLYRSGERETLELVIVPDEMSELSQNLIGVSSPLASAILEEKIGILIPFFTEEIMAVKVLEIKSGETDRKTHRIKTQKLTQDEIKAQIAFREAQLFASSSNTKWGSYDPDGWDQDSWNVPKEPKDQYIGEEETKIHEETKESLED